MRLDDPPAYPARPAHDAEQLRFRATALWWSTDAFAEARHTPLGAQRESQTEPPFDTVQPPVIASP